MLNVSPAAIFIVCKRFSEKQIIIIVLPTTAFALKNR